MSAKTIFIIIFTVLVTVFLMVNTDAVDFNFLFVEDVPVSKLLVIGVCVVIGFILGFLVGRPKTTVTSYDDRIDSTTTKSAPADGLSDEDRDYIR
ncbi:lipopolysaccharide assembly protein LapA domain-containing protein [Pedobacter sp. SYP-B3415]|uniref:lipopolysaccharide assembly protein LapA domain-containing protein n=1 Tax=Pedobacter sp. SYP-B3415 TaxID=2496641 RepID=UPI00101DF132|nr:LapA family protein [Pedobacter sp. SYP-B3415]